MGDQSNFSIQPQKETDAARSHSKADRVEPSKRDQDRFKQVLREKKKEPDDVNDAALLDEVDEAGDSIFSMSHKMAKGKKPHTKLGDSQPDLAFVDDEGEPEIGLATEDAKKGVDLSQETRPDLAQVNPLGAKDLQVGQVGIQGKAAPESVARTEMYEIATQMVEKITTMKTSGEVNTEIVLKQPPLFKGAIVKLTEFNHAKGEFNLSFENLTPQAKHIVDLDASRFALKQALEQKGYVLHIVRTNTEIEAPIETREAYARGDERQQGQRENPEDQQQEEERKG